MYVPVELRIMERKMAILLSFLFLLASGAAEEIRSNDYGVKIDEGVLKSIKQLVTTDILDLSNRGIKKIDDGVFEKVQVRIVNLESNEMFSLESGTFSGLGASLEELNLGSNQIRFIESPFVGLKNLKLLNFSNNPMAHLGPGELAGVPRTADIIVKGNTLHTFNARVFEGPSPRPSDEETVYPNARFLEDFEESLKELEEKTQIFLVADKFIDFESSASFGYQGRTIACIEDSILKKVEILAEGELLPKNCVDTETENGSLYLNLQNRGIRGVAKGWYQLQESPIAFIDLASNNLTELLPELLNDLPEAVKVVHLSENSINKIRKHSFSNVHLKVLGFRANLIDDVEDGSFASSNLSVLYFTRNKISDISFAASLPASLNLLYLNRNQIVRIPDGLFSDLAELVFLDLGWNEITKIQANAFGGLMALHAIDLTRNQISKIEVGGFSGLKNLDMISLDGNLISSFENGAFDGLGNLANLHMSSNNFTNITKKNFGRLPATLQLLDLEHNEITEIERGCFVGVPKGTLKLSNNRISKILPAQFEIDELQELSIGNNLITEINRHSFEGLPAVRSLSLPGNKISEIPRDTLKPLSALVTFDISQNPITQLKNGALYGLRKTSDSEVKIDGNQLELIQGGVFENV